METIILFAPLVGALICGFGWKLIGETTGQWITTGLLFLAALLSWVVFFRFDGVTEHIQILRWIESGSLSTDWAIRMDRLTAIMLIVITTVSSLVHLYSFGYMAHDENFSDSEPYRARFFAYLSFFTFAMLMLVTADNLVQMFFGWEGVGVASYLLIGFYYKKPSANAAAIKAFVVNRVGDFGFALGIFGLFYLTDSIRFDDIFAATPELADTSLRFLWTDWNAANLIAILLFVGAMGKSAQLFLHTWLPDAMEGPDTRVSADPRRDDGNRRCVPGQPHVAADGGRAASDDVRHLYRGKHCVCCRHDRPGSKRHQARHRVFDHVAAWVYVRCGWRRHVLGRDVPPVDPCVLQGAAVPWGRVGYPCDAPRAGHAQLWRSAQKDPLYVLGDDDRDARDHRGWYPADLYRLCGLPVQRRDYRKRLWRRVDVRFLDVGSGRCDDEFL